jgi:hypothetical protein
MTTKQSLEEWAGERAHSINPKCTGGQKRTFPAWDERHHSRKCDETKAAIIEGMRLALDAAKHSVTGHPRETRGACCWNRPATCEIEIQKSIRALQSSLTEKEAGRG